MNPEKMKNFSFLGVKNEIGALNLPKIQNIKRYEG